MAERNEKVYERVVQELAKNPQIGSRELFGIAQSVDKAIGRDTMQQFHARYYLPAKRAEKASERAASGTPAKRRTRRPRKQAAEQPEASVAPARRQRRGKRRGQESAERDQIRAALLQFAQELTDAESRSNLVQVLARVDSYVDRIAAASAR